MLQVPTKRRQGVVAGWPCTVEVEANHHPVSMEGRVRILAAVVEEPSRACSPPHGDQASGTESTGRGGAIARRSENH
jgi:hypothetical protein